MTVKNSKTIQVWPYADAPAELKALADQGGDEDWLILIPAPFVSYIQNNLGDLPHWMRVTDTLQEPKQVMLDNGDMIVVGQH